MSAPSFDAEARHSARDTNPSGSASGAQAGTPAVLTIGDLARRTGVSAATLRMWESRHGFPVPHRRASGHRRYDERHVVAVRDVARRREQGVRLEVAIQQAVAAAAADDGSGGSRESVYARLRATHPALVPQRLRKPTLLALSWAIEDELCAHSQHGHVFGAFQRQRHYAAAEGRWAELARTSASVFALADFPGEVPAATQTADAAVAAQPHLVPLPPDHPMLREWAVVCDGPDLPVVLTAFELPGQDCVRDRDRVFESMWTVEPAAVREASRLCGGVAVEAGVEAARDVVADLDAPPFAGSSAPAQIAALFNRAIAYVDDPAARLRR